MFRLNTVNGCSRSKVMVLRVSRFLQNRSYGFGHCRGLNNYQCYGPRFLIKHVVSSTAKIPHSDSLSLLSL